MRWRARSRSPARWCSGCATTCGIIDHRREIEALARDGGRQRRRLFRAGVLGSVRAALECRTRAARSLGLTRYANAAHIARAALEATAFQTREVLRGDADGLRACS